MPVETKMSIDNYDAIRTGGAGFYEHARGLTAVWGKEAVQFLDGMITNDMKTLADGAQMPAAFPNAQGRLLALVRILRDGDRSLIETEEATREKVYQNLFRFTYAGDFFAEDVSAGYSYFEIFGPKEDVLNQNVREKWRGAYCFELPHGAAYFIPNDLADNFRQFLSDENRCVAITDDLYETLRIEAGVPRYGVDMDETTIVPELGLDESISYTKGCYIGQEIIARIHFRGHVAKRLSGLILEKNGGPVTDLAGAELSSADGKGAGRITSVTFSPKLDRNIALGFVRYEFLEPGTKLKTGDMDTVVTALPFL